MRTVAELRSYEELFRRPEGEPDAGEWPQSVVGAALGLLLAVVALTRTWRS